MELIIGLYFFAWFMLVLFAILFVISGIDDLFFDAFYWIRSVYRLWKTRKYPKLSYDLLKNKPEKNIAVLLPCWQEAGVIDTMLTHNCNSIDYNNYDIFIGVYPNDPDTVHAVKKTESLIPHIHCVLGQDPGPTNKASNLNQIYQFVKSFEKRENKVYDIYVFHDSEDIIHPLSFKLYNYLIPRKDMIQLPVFPLEVDYFKFTHWVYSDEFCENHTKDIIVREAINGLVPSAGVGTAFSAKALNLLEQNNNGKPFEVYSLTEDYKTALSIRLSGLSQIFLSQKIAVTKWKKKWLLLGKYKKVKSHEYVATRALFPLEYTKSVRQKARWITGIGLQEWAHTGWVGGFSTRYTLLHDRKSIFTHIINFAGYMLFFFWLAYWYFTHDHAEFPSLQEQFNLHPWVWYLLVFVTLLMMERLIQRVIATTRIYGWIPAILSIPRIFYGNIINLHALLRAYRQYFFIPQKSKSKGVVWDKTEHHFPGSHILVAHKKKLGDLLIEKNMLTNEELNSVISEQKQTGDQIGSILRKKNHLSEVQLMQILAEQYELPFNQKEAIKRLSRQETPGISFYNYYWLMRYRVIPIRLNKKQKNITIAIQDPSNEQLIQQIIKRLKPYNVNFELYF